MQELEQPAYKIHQGRYTQKKYAEDYAAHLRANGENAAVEPATVYDVFIYPEDKTKIRGGK